MKKNEGRDGGAVGGYLARFLLGIFIMAAIFGGLLLAIDHLGLVSPAGYDRETSPPKIELFEADPATIRPGESSILSWKVSGVGLADDISIEPGIGPVAPEGDFALLPEETTTYKISASNAAGRAEARAAVTVLAVGDGESQPAAFSESETRKM
ncbi:MAG TPA: hypothetical protein PLM24_06330 [Methanothrix sp.]|nr:hypothetical protein [Methanothrix sp.]HPJ84804.1 hypothetical protein [Methanothrix sp.]HPR66737.1 hypothetical protein [Methanothrix sp.]